MYVSGLRTEFYLAVGSSEEEIAADSYNGSKGA